LPPALHDQPGRLAGHRSRKLSIEFGDAFEISPHGAINYHRLQEYGTLTFADAG